MMVLVATLTVADDVATLMVADDVVVVVATLMVADDVAVEHAAVEVEVERYLSHRYLASLEVALAVAVVTHRLLTCCKCH